MQPEYGVGIVVLALREYIVISHLAFISKISQCEETTLATG